MRVLTILLAMILFGGCVSQEVRGRAAFIESVHSDKFDSYFREVLDIVRSRWDQIVAKDKMKLVPATHVTIEFRLNSSGEVVEILKAEGNASIDETNATLSAIRGQAPYRQWTKEMIAVLGNVQIITLTFNYR